MKLTELVIKRPVTTFLVVLTLLFFGIMSLVSSKMELTPPIEMPMMVITATYPGASPEDVNELVTKPIEEQLGRLSGVKAITSQSSENVAMVLLQYNYGTDMDQAYDDLKKKIDGMSSTLPEDVDTPTIIEMDINAMASMYLSVNNSDADNIYNYVIDEVEPQLEKIPSVASVEVSGGQGDYIRIEVMPEKLAQYNLSMSSIAQMIGSADFKYPAGSTGVGSQDLSVTTAVEFSDVESLKKIPLTTGNGDTIYLEDIANVGMALEDQSAIGRFNGNDTVTVSISKNQEYTDVDVSKDVNRVLERLKEDAPNLEVEVINDNADQIHGALNSVFKTMIMAVVISMLIIFLFFGDLKASLIVGTSIPISILAALVMMWGMGFSLNVITMSSLVLGVGMMVDNSIVVLEACFRSMDKEKGRGRENFIRAALGGSKTVGMSVIGSTTTTCVVFLPLGMLSGLSGQFFQPLGFTIVFCMIASLISSVSIVPLCYIMYRPKENGKALGYGVVRSMQSGYRGIMGRLLPHKALVMITTIVLLIVSFGFASQLKFEMMPVTDEGTLAISIETRPGQKLEETDKILRQAEELVAADPNVDRYMMTYSGGGMAGSGANLTVYLKSDRTKTTKETAKDYRKMLHQISGANISVEESSSMSTMQAGSNYSVILQSVDYEDLKAASDGLVKELQSREDVTAVHSTLENAAPLIKVKVDPVAAAAEGFSPAQIGSQLNSMLSGTEATTMDVNGNELSVMVEYPKEEYDNLDKVRNITLTSPSGTTVALEDIADLVFEDSPASIAREDKQYTATISADYTDLANEKTRKTIDDEVVVKYLNSSVSLRKNAVDEMMMEELTGLLKAVLIAVFLVFVVMAAQFESMKFSLMVMLTIPFSLIGSFGFLWLADCSISMPSMLGFLMLVGTVVNNGILYVDTVNQYRAHMGMKQALIEAGATRLRPILMTTLTTVISMVPMATGYGNNGELMQGLALVDVGGLTASTILALLMLPVFYAVMYHKKIEDRPLRADVEG